MNVSRHVTIDQELSAEMVIDHEGAFRVQWSPAPPRALSEWHYTPKHGSWLDMAESELAVLASQCLDRRIPDKQILIQQVAAWEADRNAHHAKADWQFTTDDARIKLKHLYPTF